MEATNGKDFDGKQLKVNYAFQPKPQNDVKNAKKEEPANKKQKTDEKSVAVKKEATVAAASKKN